MGLGLSIKVDDAAIKGEMAKLIKRASDARPAFRAYGEHLVTSTRKRFDTETAPDGSKWPDISEKWRKRKASEGRSTSILTYLGRLRQSFIYKVSAKGLIWGTNVKAPGGFAYPELFQRGSRYQVQRVFLGLSRDDIKAGLSIFKSFLRGDRG